MRQDIERMMPQSFAPALAAGANLLLPTTSQLRKKLVQHGEVLPAMMVDMLTLGLPLAILRAAARGPLAAALKSCSPMETVLPLLRKPPPEEVGLVNSMRYLDLKLTLAGDLLVTVDRASMAVS